MWNRTKKKALWSLPTQCTNKAPLIYDSTRQVNKYTPGSNLKSIWWHCSIVCWLWATWMNMWMKLVASQYIIYTAVVFLYTESELFVVVEIFFVVEKNLYWVFCTAMLRKHVLVCLFEWHLFFLVISIFPLLFFGHVRNSLIY